MKKGKFMKLFKVLIAVFTAYAVAQPVQVVHVSNNEDIEQTYDEISATIINDNEYEYAFADSAAASTAASEIYHFKIYKEHYQSTNASNSQQHYIVTRCHTDTIRGRELGYYSDPEFTDYGRPQ